MVVAPKRLLFPDDGSDGLAIMPPDAEIGIWWNLITRTEESMSRAGSRTMDARHQDADLLVPGVGMQTAVIGVGRVCRRARNSLATRS